MKLQVNQSNLLANLSTVFTDKTKVVTELVQNARRAGASKVFLDYELSDDKTTVSSITILDNGSGIRDFTKLFTLAESGWDAAIQSTEHPYGMGFFATLTCAKTVTIQSNGQQMVVDSAQALSGADIGEAHEVDFFGGTKIVLSGVDIKEHVFTSFLISAFLYSSIDILINGVAARRSLALSNTDKNKVVETPFGQLVMDEWFISAATVVVQDMRIGSFNCSTRWSNPNTLFANQRIQARMPDRDSILNRSEVEAEFNTWLTGFYQAQLTAIRAEFADDFKFIERHFLAVLNYYPEMLNEINWLPASAFYAAQYPVLGGSTDCDSKGVTFDVERKTLESGQVFIAANHADIYSNEYVMSHFLYRSNALILTDEAATQLPQNHWARAFIRDVVESDFTVTFKEFRAPISIELANIYHFSVSQCDGIEILYSPTGQSICIQDDCIYFAESDASIEYPTDFKAGSVVVGDFNMQSLLLQISSYEDEYGSMLDDLLEKDTRSAELQFKAGTGVNASDILSDLIGNLPASIKSALAGKVFLAKVVDGRMQFDQTPIAA